MYKQCRTEQSAQRQRELEQGLLEAMRERDYDEISVSDLCDRMAVPRKSFYRYFSSKDGALYALIDHALMDFESFAGTEFGSSKRTLQQDMERVFAYWKQRQDLLEVLERSDLSGVLVQRAINHSVSETTLPRRFLPQDERVAQEYITKFAVCGLMTIVLQWHHDGYPQSVGQMAQIAMRLMTLPLFPDAEKFY